MKIANILEAPKLILEHEDRTISQELAPLVIGNLDIANDKSPIVKLIVPEGVIGLHVRRATHLKEVTLPSTIESVSITPEITITNLEEFANKDVMIRIVGDGTQDNFVNLTHSPKTRIEVISSIDAFKLEE